MENLIITFDDPIVPAEIVSKTNLERLTRHYVQMIEDGEVSAMDAVVKMHSVGKLVEGVTKNIMVKDAVLAELEKYGTKSVKYEGVTFQIKEVGVRHDFSTCCDPVWMRLKVRLDIATAAIKEREDFLKMIPLEGMTIVDELTGEVFHAVRPTKSGETGYLITIDK